MKFGFSLSGLSPRYYPELAQEAERAGFESVWIPDHLVFPDVLPATYLYSEDGNAPITSSTAVYDPWVLLGAIAATTSTIRLANNVYVLPLRHPIITARAVLTVDRISHGRVTLGIGVGWLKEEFDIVGEDPSNRGARTDEIIPLLRRLWSEDVISHHGEHYDFPDVRFEPKPFQQPVPIEVGGTSKAALRRAGALGDGWIELGSKSDEEFLARLAVVQQARVEAGRAELPFTVSGGARADASAEDIRRSAELGVSRVIVGPSAPHRRLTKQDYSEVIARFGEEVIPFF